MSERTHGRSRRRTEVGAALAGWLLLVALFAGSSVPQGAAQGGVSLEEALRQRESRLQELRAKRSAWEDERRQQVADVDARLAALDERLSAAEAAVATVQERVAELESAAAGSDSGAVEVEPEAELLAELADAAIPVVEAVRRRIERGIPHRRGERSARAAGILEELRAADPLAQGEALAALASFAEDEVRLAGSIALENTPVYLDEEERRVHAWRVRLGLANELLLAENEDTVGVASETPQPAWRLELTEAERAAVRGAVAVLRERRRPELQALPFPLAPASSAKAAGVDAVSAETGSSSSPHASQATKKAATGEASRANLDSSAEVPR